MFKNYFVRDNHKTYKENYPNHLWFLHHDKTGLRFLADTGGSVVNLIELEDLSREFPNSSMLNIDVPITGIGGEAAITQMTFLDVGASEKIPFCTGKAAPLNIVGISWIDAVLSSPDIQLIRGPMTRAMVVTLRMPRAGDLPIRIEREMDGSESSKEEGLITPQTCRN